MRDGGWKIGNTVPVPVLVAAIMGGEQRNTNFIIFLWFSVLRPDRENGEMKMDCSDKVLKIFFTNLKHEERFIHVILFCSA